MDDFAGIKRYVETIMPVDMQLGKVESVDSSVVQVRISSGNPQPATYNPSMAISRGDDVFMLRPRSVTALWSVVAVIGKREAGLSNSNRPTIGQNPGGRIWANPTVTLPGTFYDVSSGTKADIITLEKDFNGGTPLIVIAGSAAPTTTAATLILGHAIDSIYQESYRHYMATTNSYSIGHTFMGGGALHGTHTFRLYAAVSPANTIRVTPSQYSIVEI